MNKLIAIWLAVCAFAFAPFVHSAEPDKTTLTVFGAASLTNVLQDLGDAFTKETSIAVKFSFAASSTLARQIENGAPADIFMSADSDWMDYLQARHLIQDATRHDIVGNRLVLIGPVDSTVKLKIEPKFALAAALGQGHLATGDPAAVPAGRYAQAALTKLGVWKDVEDRIVRADSVRSALTFVDRGEAPLGIVYETDALVDKKVRVIDVFPADSHAPIVYPVALTHVAQPGAAKFVAFIASPAAAQTFKSYGFVLLH
jgi:molybdate transport system substrate-binding protein